MSLASIAVPTEHLPAGPSQGRLVATRQARHLVARVFDTLRLALARAIHRGLVAALAFAGAAMLAAALLGDVPAEGPPDEGP